MIDEHTPEWFRDKLDHIADEFGDWIATFDVGCTWSVSDESDDDDLTFGFVHVQLDGTVELTVLTKLLSDIPGKVIGKYQDENVVLGDNDGLEGYMDVDGVLHIPFLTELG